jgi:hypothetical protein
MQSVELAAIRRTNAEAAEIGALVASDVRGL